MIPNYKKNSMKTREACQQAQRAIRDTLDIVGGKWKLVLLTILRDRTMRFNQLSREAGISPRILSKELEELQMNGLVNREVQDTKPITVEYSLTPYSQTLNGVLDALENWGKQHREHLFKQAE